MTTKLDMRDYSSDRSLVLYFQDLRNEGFLTHRYYSRIFEDLLNFGNTIKMSRTKKTGNALQEKRCVEMKIKSTVNN